MRIPNASMHNVFLTCSYSVLLFCFPWRKKINSGETTDVWNPVTCIKKPLPTWSEEDNNIHVQFALQVCVLWHFQSSVRYIYLFVIIHKGFSSLWMCCLRWIMFTLQFMTDKSLVIFHTTSSTFNDPSLMVLNSRVEVQWYATNVHPMSIATTFLCVLFSYDSINSLCTDNIFVSNCFAFVFFVYFLNMYKLIQVTSSQETISSYYHARK